MEPTHAPHLGAPFGLDCGVIRDSLYSRVPVNQHVLSIMATPEYLRLQRVKQLGWVFTVWPGATHTRYEHSLGVYHLARRALESLLALGALPAATDAELRVFLAAALLHDVGHYPYSHGIEELGPPVATHEQVGIRVIQGANISSTLEQWGVDPAAVTQLVSPVEGGDAPISYAHVYRALLSGALDVDKLDYLPRDARACNVPYGGVDVERLLDSLRVLDTSDGPRLALSEKGISPLHSLVRARQEMFDNVYWHHTNRACMAMLLRAVQDALDAGAVRAQELTGQDDASLLTLLSSRAMPPTTRALIGALSVRRIHKRALELANRSGPAFEKVDALFYDPTGRKQLELQLCTAVAAATGLHVAAHELLLDIPKPEKWEVDVLVRYDRPPVGMERVMSWQETTGMTGADLAVYEAHQRRIRLVTSARLRDHVWELRDSTIIPTMLKASA